VKTMDDFPYSPDLATVDFYLLSRLKSALKERRICDATDVIKNPTKNLKSISRNGFRNVSNTFTVADKSE